jgi:hypothetical protein
MIDELIYYQERIQELEELIDRARRLTASEPDNTYCRQATILLNYALTHNANN